MRIVVLGSGTSSGVPTLGCKCAVCTSDDPHNKRMRASVYIETHGKRFLIDCGTDFRSQAIAQSVEDVDFVLLTHTHADHVNGLDDLRAYNMVHRHAIDIYGEPEALEEVRRRFAYCFRPAPPGGGIPELNLRQIDSTIQIDDLSIQPIRVFHGKMPILGFRIGAFAYLTDVSTIPESSFEQLEGVELLITSALRHRPHPTHMSLSEALQVAARVGARQTYFTHMNHDLDHEQTNAQLPPQIQLAYDGLRLEV